METIYLRVKRRKEVYFLHIKPSETFETLKEMISEITGQRKELIQFYKNDKSVHEREVYDDKSKIERENLESDTTIFMVYAESHQEDEKGDLVVKWEELYIPKPSEANMGDDDLSPNMEDEDDVI